MLNPQSYLVELKAYDTHKRVTLCKPVKIIRHHTRMQDETSVYFELERLYRGQYIINRIKKLKKS